MPIMQIRDVFFFFLAQHFLSVCHSVTPHGANHTQRIHYRDYRFLSISQVWGMNWDNFDRMGNVTGHFSVNWFREQHFPHAQQGLHCFWSLCKAFNVILCNMLCVKVKVKMLVAQPCWTLCDPARLLCPWDFPGKNILGWVAILISRESSWPRDRTWVSCTAGSFFNVWVAREALAKDAFLTYDLTQQGCPRNTGFPSARVIWHTHFPCSQLFHFPSWR